MCDHSQSLVFHLFFSSGQSFLLLWLWAFVGKDLSYLKAPPPQVRKWEFSSHWCGLLRIGPSYDRGNSVLCWAAFSHCIPIMNSFIGCRLPKREQLFLVIVTVFLFLTLWIWNLRIEPCLKDTYADKWQRQEGGICQLGVMAFGAFWIPDVVYDRKLHQFLSRSITHQNVSF